MASSDAEAYASWGESYWRVEATPAKNGEFLVHYVGWDPKWDETVSCDRLRRSSGGVHPLWVEWHGSFYEGSIVREERQGTRVHYVGYDASWDEVVPASRLVRLDAYCK